MEIWSGVDKMICVCMYGCINFQINLGSFISKSIHLRHFVLSRLLFSHFISQYHYVSILFISTQISYSGEGEQIILILWFIAAYIKLNNDIYSAVLQDLPDCTHSVEL